MIREATEFLTPFVSVRVTLAEDGENIVLTPTSAGTARWVREQEFASFGSRGGRVVEVDAGHMAEFLSEEDFDRALAGEAVLAEVPEFVLADALTL